MNAQISGSCSKIASCHLLCICRISTPFLLCFLESVCLNKETTWLPFCDMIVVYDACHGGRTGRDDSDTGVFHFNTLCTLNIIFDSFKQSGF